MRAGPCPQSGFSALIALVLVTMLGLIGVYMTTQGTVANVSTAVSFSGIRAWFAAQSGAEWAALRALTGSCAASTPLSIDGLTVTVTCSSTSVSEPPDTYNIFSISSTASLGVNGDLTRVSRTVRTFVTDAP